MGVLIRKYRGSFLFTGMAKLAIVLFLASLTDSRIVFVSRDMMKPRANNRMRVSYKNLVMEISVL